MQTIEEMLDLVEEPHHGHCLKFIDKFRHLFNTSKGSATKHQAWIGGYRDHITEVMNIAVATYGALQELRALPFSLSDALLGCFLHDIEKVWVHAIGGTQPVIKDNVLAAHFRLSDDLFNAIHYAHGEGADYHPTERIQGPLAAFVHHCDNTSARIWFDYPQKDLADEYEMLLSAYYPDKITDAAASRMMWLERRLGIETLVPVELRKKNEGTS